ncbi:NmrA family NAD(P)-binding protein [Planotetraspora kaengkrachanensis]|uniref:Nucleotide-diphosphate-sugar epimerase n=1 Tax=Planotetraspora kaengkrachanensis TaxID=575193 RepID=A0A8J3M1Q9_9ACTN|nr:NmrA family NAD(P)-binding protein [Planotetraspora kaengkrachanensis]GIG77754.1 nucleotide-diphosphate-sugar epimerase [Planotetraspora kaengkrachanensis]
MANDDRLFLVTAATGRTGSGTIRLLLQHGHRVRAMVHREDERSRSLAEAGAEVVVSDFHDLDGVTAALQGVTGAYLCHPIAPGLIEATTYFAQAATEAGVRSVVNMSQISARREAGSDAARQHWLCERLLDRTGMLTAHLRPTFFAEWLKLWWELRDGEGYLRLPFGEGRHAPIASVDQAHVIATVLIDPEPHDRAVYTLHGPVELNHHGIAGAMSGTLGIPVHYEPISVEEFASAMAERGLTAHRIQHLSNVAVDYQNGVFAGTNDNIEKIGQRAPLSVEQFVLDNKPDFEISGPYFVPAP